MELVPLCVKWEMEAENRAFICPSEESHHRAFIESSNKEHWTLMHESRPVGFVLLDGLDDSDQRVELKRIVVAEKGRGFGKAAMQWVQNRAKEQLNAKVLWLDVFEDNSRARYLYEKQGFMLKEKRACTVENVCGEKELLILELPLN